MYQRPGRRRIVGTVETLQQQPTSYYPRLMMTVRDATGQRYLGTVPTAWFATIEVGATVSFTGTCKPHWSDPTIDTYSNPKP